jgi:hypothetical protein
MPENLCQRATMLLLALMLTLLLLLPLHCGVAAQGLRPTAARWDLRHDRERCRKTLTGPRLDQPLSWQRSRTQTLVSPSRTCRCLSVDKVDEPGFNQNNDPARQHGSMTAGHETHLLPSSLLVLSRPHTLAIRSQSAMPYPTAAVPASIEARRAPFDASALLGRYRTA